MKITTQDVSQLLNVREQVIRCGIRNGAMDIGCAVKRDERYTYIILPDKLATFMGITLEELERRLKR